MKMPEVDRAVLARRCEIAERLRNVVGREWVLDAESERRPYESDGLMAYVLAVVAVFDRGPRADTSNTYASAQSGNSRPV
jgi:hypothetical protein